jgi:hypothetical protein
MASYFFGNDRNLSFAVHFVGCTIASVFDRAYKLSVSGRLTGYICEGYMMP